MRLDCPYCRRASTDLARATGNPQAVMSCTQHPEDNVPTADPRIDPALLKVMHEKGCDCQRADLSECVVYDIFQKNTAAILRAAREAGADAVTVEGGLVKWVEDEPSSVVGKIGEVLATGGLSLIGQTNRAWRLVPLDGGDDGE